MSEVRIRTKEISKQEARQLLKEMAENYDANENLQETIDELTAYEAQYDMSTVQFYPQFIAGKLGDSEDFIIWASLYEAYVELTQPHLLAQVAA